LVRDLILICHQHSGQGTYWQCSIESWTAGKSALPAGTAADIYSGGG